MLMFNIHIILYLIMILNYTRSFSNILLITKNLPIVYLNDNDANTLEHIYPKCYLDKSHHYDMHNLFKCNKYINNMRSNYKFTEKKNYTLDNNNWLNIGNNFINKKDKLFIPDNKDKGLISRTILYMCYKYNYKPNIIIDINNLLKWSYFEPSNEEYNHNDFVYKIQKKRNMFIDNFNNKEIYKKLKNKLLNEL